MAIDRSVLARSLAAIAAEQETDEGLVERLCVACAAALPVDGAGLSLMTGNSHQGRSLLGATDDVSRRIEELQFSLGEGPCISAFDEGRPVLVPDLGADEARSRWPLFTHELGHVEAGALFAFPLQVGAITIGAMNCHRRAAGPLAEVREALLVADALAAALLSAQARETSGNEHSDLLRSSWRDHARVHQATGMLTVQLGVSAEEGFARLRAEAFSQGRSLDEVADDVVTRRHRFTRNHS